MIRTSAGYAGSKEVEYFFIDGEQLRQTAIEVGNDWLGKPFEIDYAKLQGNHLKVFYYDCLPAKRGNEPADKHEQKRAEKHAFFDRLRALQGWHVSEGLARHRKKERQEQKEVDILIAVDMLTHTHRRNMHRLTFLSGDQDFAPLLEAVVREGMYVQLLYPEGHTSRDLMHFADVARPMDVDFFWGIAPDAFQRATGFPAHGHEFDGTPRRAELVEEGFLDGRAHARAWRSEEGLFVVKATVQNSSGYFYSVSHPDQRVAKRYFERTSGALEWRAPPSPASIASLGIARTS